MKDGYFKTGKRLKIAIDNYERIDGMKDYLDSSFAYRMFDLDYGSDPSWDEALNGTWFEPSYWMLYGAIDYNISGKREYDIEDLMCEYIPGYYEPLNYGDTQEHEGNTYEYLTSLPLPEGMEHLAENGDLEYEYRGHSFVRIWLKIDKKEDR